ncbi:transcriptional regulator [Sphaerochaeta pleomorpha str. Grapes]|uniref:Transcriptional regulator n=1 Tax=Sphaerochaeta pleomorpha (strain ATCC BAA-1885 / DSM 22778 / Grapes) TaxID=158190 RepID=G8QRA5_SPHPG|nr:LacI family DNA-binding transcriptional regulator [Sphaerochaeta pleomorpha]AEV28758.1 transcriptional regulator [Sphaerochaeta pleomorpha str. Grapes]
MVKEANKITYSKIAELSGISMATISRVMNNSTNVKEETRRTVMDAMRQLGYDTTDLEAIAAKSNDLLIFNIPSLDNPFYSLIIKGAKASAERNGYNMLINEDPIDDRSIDTFIALLKKTNAAGILSTNCISKQNLMKLDAILPIVQCCECDPSLDIPFVTIDDVSAARNAVEYILSLGRRRIAFINGPLQYKYARDRLKGYLEALEDAHIERDPDIIIQLQEINYDMAVSAVFQLLNSEKRPDAFFASSDVYAAAAIKATKRTALKVPRDIAIVGFDNIELSSMCSPSITTVNQPKFQLGLLSCEMLIKRICKEQIPIRSMYMDTELIVRETTQKQSPISRSPLQ